MTHTFDHAEDVLRDCVDRHDVALVVLTSVTGGTLRARGTLMAVTPSNVAGYISNGCVDADIIARARTGQSGRFVYGEGSPYRDIVLPCGGQLEIAIFQNPNKQDMTAAIAELGNRRETELKLGEVSISLVPRIKLRICGRGAVCLSLAELAELSGFEVFVQSPDPDQWSDAQHLMDPYHPPAVSDDFRTAVVCLFHDHDWEFGLLQQALAGPAFYIGAMGSQHTQDMRCQKLSELGTNQQDVARIKGPIGLVKSQRNARFLAVSILAEIIDTAQKAGLL